MGGGRDLERQQLSLRKLEGRGPGARSQGIGNPGPVLLLPQVGRFPEALDGCFEDSCHNQVFTILPKHLLSSPVPARPVPAFLQDASGRHRNQVYSPIPGLPLLSVNIFLLPLPSQSLVEDLGACAKGSGGAGEKLISPKNVLTHTKK